MKAKITEKALKVETERRETWLFADYIGWDFVYLLPSLYVDLHYYNGNITVQFGFLCFTVCLDIFKKNK